jgi:hypothetical protein
MNMGKTKEAIAQFSTLLSITPGDREARELLTRLTDGRH